MRLWRLEPSEKAGGYFFVRDRVEDGEVVGKEYGDVFFKDKAIAERGLAIRNDRILEHAKPWELEAVKNA